MDKTIKIFLYFLMVVISIWLFDHIQTGRYEIQTGRYKIYLTSKPIGYKLDTQTGKVSYLYGGEERKIER